MIELNENEYLDKIVDIIINNIIDYIVQYLKNKDLDKYIIFKN